MSAADLVRNYGRLGWHLLPVPANSKAPIVPGWQHIRFDIAEIEGHVAAGGNVGFITGPASGGVVDVDLDCPEAIALAEIYLPETHAIFGRLSNPASHWLYRSPGAVYTSFADPTDRRMLLELRAPGRDGGAHQSLLPPSATGGEARVWHDGRNIVPAPIDAAILAGRCAWLAIATLMARHVSGYAARRPWDDLPDLLWEADPVLGRGAFEWLGLLAPDERPADIKPRRYRTHPDLRLEEVVAAIVNDFDWAGWNRLGMAIYAASGGSQHGFVCFDDLSSRSPKYDPHSVLERWNNYRRSPPTRIGIGAIIHVARQCGWKRSAA